MAVKLISLKCPECGAQINIESNRAFAFCTYCGTKVIVNNENEFVYRHIDEAELMQAETERISRDREFALEERKYEDEKRKKQLRLKVLLIGFVISIILTAGGWKLGDLSGNSDSGFYALACVGELLIFMYFIFGFMYVIKVLFGDKNEQ